MNWVALLLSVFNRLVYKGNTVIVIEHNQEVIKTADYLVDLGPESGDGGGKIVALSPPEDVAHHPESHTGRFLRELLQNWMPNYMHADGAEKLAAGGKTVGNAISARFRPITTANVCWSRYRASCFIDFIRIKSTGNNIEGLGRRGNCQHQGQGHLCSWLRSEVGDLRN